MDYSVKSADQLALILKGIRQNAGLTQKDVSYDNGLLQKTVSLLENTPEKSSVGSLFKLLSALEVDIVLQPRKTNRHKRVTSAEW